MQALWRLARSGSAAPDALVIAQLQMRGAALGVALALLLVRRRPRLSILSLNPDLAAMPHHHVQRERTANFASWCVMQ